MSNILKRLSNASHSSPEPEQPEPMKNDFPTRQTTVIRQDDVKRKTASGSVITSDVKFDGEIEFSDSLTVYGELKGSITSKGDLMLEKGATVDAQINARSLTVRGEFKGEINADQSVELLSNANIYGNINAKAIKVEDGVTFVGKANIKSK